MLRMSRADLHALVWSKPMTQIAQLYGVRDQHVASACDSHGIARPRVGHWQRVKHGKAAQATALDNEGRSPEEIVVVDPAAGRTGRRAA